MSSFSDLVNQLSKGSVKESAKPAKRIGKSFKVESRVEHPTKGKGVIVSLSETAVGVRWDRLDLRILGEDKLGAAEAKHLKVIESYAKDSKKAAVGKKTVKKIDAKKAKGKKKVTEAIAAIPGMFVGRGEKLWKNDSLVLDAYDLGLLEADEDAPAARTGGEVGTNDLNNDNVEAMPVTTQSPLSTEGGFESASEGGEDNLEMPDDALDAINWKRMEAPGQGNTRSASAGGDASSGNGSKETNFGKSSAPKSDSSEKSDSDSDSDRDESKESKFEQNKFKKADESRKAKPSYRKLTEGMTLADADIEHILVECTGDGMVTSKHEMMDGVGGMPTSAPKQLPNPSMMNEHDMAAGEIAVTQEFLVKLLKAAVKHQLADDKLSVVAQAVAECCAEDRTLDVADIGMVMGKLKELADGAGSPAAAPVAPAASMGAPAEVPAEEPASEPDFGGDEGSEEAPAEEPDFGGDEGSEEEVEVDRVEVEEPARDEGDSEDDRDSEKKSDEDSEKDKDNEFEDKAEGDGDVAGAEGGEEHEGKTKLMSGQMKPWEKDEEEKDEVKESRRKKVAKGKKPLKEAWLSKVPGMSPLASPSAPDVGREEEKELAMIRRRAGLPNWWKN